MWMVIFLATMLSEIFLYCYFGTMLFEEVNIGIFIKALFTKYLTLFLLLFIFFFLHVETNFCVVPIKSIT
jgi:hypothetical protein